MNSKNFAYLIYDGKLAVFPKIAWNAKGGYVPDNNDATIETGLTEAQFGQLL